MNILITCPRAPVTIEWLKLFLKHNDNNNNNNNNNNNSLNFPIAIFFKHPNIKYIKISSPKLNFEKYKQDILSLINSHDYIIPNCEDIFFLSQAIEPFYHYLKNKILIPNKDLLFKVHNKNIFQSMITFQNTILSPKTNILYSKEDIDFDIGYKTLLKPVYSRFGRDVIRDINTTQSKNNIATLLINKSTPWVQQEFIEGNPLCNYAICQNGIVKAHSCYVPKYLLNNAASTYFEEITNEHIEKFTIDFVKKYNYTGQIAFDFIINNKGDIYILECNPRATSGLHLINGKNLDFYPNFDFYMKKDLPKTILKSYKVGLSLYLLFGIQTFFKGMKYFKQLQFDFNKAQNVLEGLPFYSQFFALIEMAYRSYKYKKPFTNASTFDIEYDGQEDNYDNK